MKFFAGFIDMGPFQLHRPLGSLFFSAGEHESRNQTERDNRNDQFFHATSSIYFHIVRAPFLFVKEKFAGDFSVIE